MLVRKHNRMTNGLDGLDNMDDQWIDKPSENEYADNHANLVV